MKSIHNIFAQSILEPDLQEVVTGATASWGNLLTVRKFCGLNHNNSMDNFLFPQNGKICHKILMKNTNVIFHVNNGRTDGNSLSIIGENRKEKIYQILKF